MTRGPLAALAAIAVALFLLPGPAQAVPEQRRLVAYGHSWVSGHGVDRPYPTQVASRLDYDLVNRAYPGDTTAATSTRALLYPPRRDDVVVLETGLNDARGYGRRGVVVYRELLGAALDAMSRARLVVLVLEQPIPHWDAYEPFNRGRPEVVAAYREAQREVAAKRPNVVTVSADLRRGDFRPDGVHPDKSGHIALARAVIRAVRRSDSS